MPDGKCTSEKSCVSGIMTAWYGMKSPKRKNVKTMSAPGKRHFESTKPFREPSTTERIVAGITSLKLLPRFGESWCHAWLHADTVHACGSDHACDGSVSRTPLKLVTTRT